MVPWHGMRRTRGGIHGAYEWDVHVRENHSSYPRWLLLQVVSPSHRVFSTRHESWQYDRC